MIKVKEAIIVEGKYDKIHLSNLVDGLIVPVGGFGIYKNRELCSFIRSLAQTRGIVILTDSDAAGFRLRNYLKNIAASGRVFHAYIPDIAGKEKRKSAPSAEGKLGVEGIDPRLLADALRKAGVITEASTDRYKDNFTTADLYELGLAGTADSKAKRKRLLHRLQLPEHLSTSMMVKCLGSYITKEELRRFAEEEEERGGAHRETNDHSVSVFGCPDFSHVGSGDGSKPL